MGVLEFLEQVGKAAASTNILGFPQQVQDKIEEDRRAKLQGPPGPGFNANPLDNFQLDRQVDLNLERSQMTNELFGFNQADQDRLLAVQTQIQQQVIDWHDGNGWDEFAFKRNMNTAAFLIEKATDNASDFANQMTRFTGGINFGNLQFSGVAAGNDPSGGGFNLALPPLAVSYNGVDPNRTGPPTSGNYPTGFNFGGGSTRAEPQPYRMPTFHPDTYQKPDRRTVEALIEAKLKILVGEADPARVKKLTEVYLAEDKRNFLKMQDVKRDQELAKFDDAIRLKQRADEGAEDAEGAVGVIDVEGNEITERHKHLEEVEALDPLQNVLELIRADDDYKQFHKNRPTDMNEEDWLTQAISLTRQQGIGGDAAVERGKILATGGDITADATMFNAQQQFKIPTFIKRAGEVAGLIGSMAR